jgi:chromosome segregation ATPase
MVLLRHAIAKLQSQLQDAEAEVMLLLRREGGSPLRGSPGEVSRERERIRVLEREVAELGRERGQLLRERDRLREELLAVADREAALAAREAQLGVRERALDSEREAMRAQLMQASMWQREATELREEIRREDETILALRAELAALRSESGRVRQPLARKEGQVDVEVEVEIESGRTVDPMAGTAAGDPEVADPSAPHERIAELEGELRSLRVSYAKVSAALARERYLRRQGDITC